MLLFQTECFRFVSSVDAGDDWTLVEWYEKNPTTGERGWSIHSGWINGKAADVRREVESLPFFDCIVSCYDASPNPGDRVLALIY